MQSFVKKLDKTDPDRATAHFLCCLSWTANTKSIHSTFMSALLDTTSTPLGAIVCVGNDVRCSVARKVVHGVCCVGIMFLKEQELTAVPDETN